MFLTLPSKLYIQTLHPTLPILQYLTIDGKGWSTSVFAMYLKQYSNISMRHVRVNTFMHDDKKNQC